MLSEGKLSPVVAREQQLPYPSFCNRRPLISEFRVPPTSHSAKQGSGVWMRCRGKFCLMSPGRRKNVYRAIRAGECHVLWHAVCESNSVWACVAVR